MIEDIARTIAQAVVITVVFLGAFVLLAPSIQERLAEPPLMLRPEHVAGPWPFTAPEVEVSCCTQRRISLVGPREQHYGWPGDRHYDRFPVTALGPEGTPAEAFAAARTAALALAQERWPELSPR